MLFISMIILPKWKWATKYSAKVEEELAKLQCPYFYLSFLVCVCSLADLSFIFWSSRSSSLWARTLSPHLSQLVVRFLMCTCAPASWSPGFQGAHAHWPTSHQVSKVRMHISQLVVRFLALWHAPSSLGTVSKRFTITALGSSLINHDCVTFECNFSE